MRKTVRLQRRDFTVLACAALVAPRVLFAQAARRIYRIAILNDGSEETRRENWAAFRDRLRELGLKEGENAVFEVRHARGQNDRLAPLAAELVAGKPDIVVCPGTPSALAGMKATSSIPVIFVAAGSPEKTGLVASLSHPGGNVTGTSVVTTEVSEKSLELLREVLPGIKRVAYLGDASNPAVADAYKRVESYARRLNLSIRFLDAAGQPAMERSFATIQRERIQGLYVDASGSLLVHRSAIVQFAAQERLPTVYGRRDYSDVGGLLSYEADRNMAYVRGAELVHRVLQGAKPADLPVEQISVFRMTLNLKTARATGLKIPASVRLRADEVIE